MPEESKILKLCDRFDNTKDLKSCDVEFQTFYAFETEFILNNISVQTEAGKALVKDIWNNINKYV